MTDKAGNPLNLKSYIGTCDRADAMDAIDFVVLVYTDNINRPIEVRLVQAKAAGNELEESDEIAIKNKHKGYARNVQRSGQSRLEGMAAEKIIARESSEGATEDWTKKVESLSGDGGAEKIIGQHKVVIDRYLSILEEVGKTLPVEADGIFNKVRSLEHFRKNVVAAAFSDYKTKQEGLNSGSIIEIYEMALVLQQAGVLDYVEVLLKIRHKSRSKKGNKYPDWVLQFKEKLKSWAELVTPPSLELLRMCPEVDPGSQVLAEKYVSVIRHGSKKPIEKVVIERGLTKSTK
jgi:hypothetical protein